MKALNLLFALTGLALAPLVAANEGYQPLNPHESSYAIRVWNEEYQTYVEVPVEVRRAATASTDFFAEADASDWIRSELRWNEEYDVYVAMPVLEEDPFQERMVYSNYYTDFVRFGEALRVALEQQTAHAKDEALVWSDHYTDYVPQRMAEGRNPIEDETRQFLARVMPKPCPEFALQEFPLRVAAKD